MIDSYGRNITYLRLSVTELCNLRCRYCMPEEGVCKHEHIQSLTEDEMIMAVETAAALGVTKLRITGGEPLVKRNIVSLCRRAAAVEGIKDLAITTNGVLLPKLGRELKEAGVKRLNISLDTLDADKYAYITRIGTLESAMAGIEAAIDLGFDKIKLNAVLIGGFNDDEIRPLAELTKKYPLDMRFIEMMPMYDSGDFKEAAFVPYTKVLEVLPELEKVQQDGGVASLYRLPEAKGNIGLISPLNAHFCGTCNRIRLTSDGKLKPCLHSSVEYPIKGLDREGMMEQFKTAIYGKPQWHGELNATERSKAGRNMNQIGG
jgi:cyclic pyranopterin phosphate synthase